MNSPEHLDGVRQADFSRLYIFGAGGAGREIAWLATESLGESIELVFLVDGSDYLSPPVNGIPVQLISDVAPSPDARVVIALGNSGERRRVAHLCTSVGLQPITLVHPRVEMSNWVRLHEGAVICAGAVLTTNIAVGRHVYMNINCSISHDVTIGDFTTISPGVHISGHVEVGCGVFIGTGASVINGRAGAPLRIGDGAVIAAGACITKSVEPNAMMAGVPAIRKR